VEQIAIIAALTREVAALVRGHAADPTLRARGVHLYRISDRAVVVAAGIGAERAALAVEAALAAAPVTMLVSAGLAGSCSAGLAAGAVVETRQVVDVRTGERFAADVPDADAARDGGITLATAEAIAGVQEKARLAAAYGAAAVDMEAATVGRLARAHGLRFRAIKGISDGSEFELAALGRFTGRHGSFRTGAFALHTALRPWQWGQAIELGRGSAQALAALDVALKKVIAGKS